ncbi:hypothetical protein HOY80DRAFT_1090960 [Tuber brumale]|nr:hypothetical protein HOY80DRAFT_1090960 [Tuber brumale]
MPLQLEQYRIPNCNKQTTTIESRSKPNKYIAKIPKLYQHPQASKLPNQQKQESSGFYGGTRSASQFIKAKRTKADMSPLPLDASPFAPHSPPSPPSLVARADHKSITASTIIAVLSLCAVFLALAFLVGYGVYRFGTGFLLGKRSPRRCGGVTDNTGGAVGGISAGVSEVKGDARRDGGGEGGKEKEKKGKGEVGSGELDTVIEVPEGEEGEEKGQGSSGRNRTEGEAVDVEVGRWL